MSAGSVLTLVINGALVALLLAVVVIYFQVRKRARDIFGAPTVREGLEKQRRELATTPKSVSGMTKLCLPLIQKDFPDFHLNDFVARAQNALTSALLALAKEDAGLVRDAGNVLEEAVRLQIEDNRQRQIRQFYSGIKIHRTEIAKYEKRDGTCTVTLQMAVGHLHYALQGDKVVEGDRDYQTQTRYNVEIVYVQDADKVKGDLGAVVGAQCPNCGAPVKTLGTKYCQYCGSGVREVNIHSWIIHRFYEVDYHKA